MMAFILILKIIGLISFILLAVKVPKKKKEEIQKERSNTFIVDNNHIDVIRYKPLSSGTVNPFTIYLKKQPLNLRNSFLSAKFPFQ
jgi:hypothetical protein